MPKSFQKVSICFQFYSLKTSLTNKLNTSAIANDLTTTTAGYVLDARQGKELNRRMGAKVYVIDDGGTKTIWISMIALVMCPYNNANTFIAMVSSSGATAIVGTIPSDISISKLSGSSFTITNNHGWAVPFTILGYSPDM